MHARERAFADMVGTAFDALSSLSLTVVTVLTLSDAARGSRARTRNGLGGDEKTLEESAGVLVVDVWHQTSAASSESESSGILESLRCLRTLFLLCLPCLGGEEKT